MGHFECRLNGRFWRSKKVVQIGGWGYVEVIWTKSKRTVTFFVKPSLISDADADNLIIFINAQTLDYRSASVLYLRQAAQWISTLIPLFPSPLSSSPSSQASKPYPPPDSLYKPRQFSWLWAHSPCEPNCICISRPIGIVWAMKENAE